MNRIVLTTSSSGLDNYNVDTNIRQIRLHIHVGNVDFVDGKSIDRDRLIYLINEVTQGGVNTSPASEEEVRAIFEELSNQNFDEVLILTLSSKISESYEIITKVAQEYKQKMDIKLFDTKELNSCEAILALEAEHLLKQGKNIAQIWLELTKLRDSHKTLFAVNDLSQLVRNKKISTTSAFFAGLFDIKPVLHLSDDGEIVPLNKIRRFDKALDFMINRVKENLRVDSDFLYVLCGGNTEMTAQFVTAVKESLGIDYLPVLPVSSISIANHGINIVGLCVFQGKVPSVLKSINL